MKLLAPFFLCLFLDIVAVIHEVHHMEANGDKPSLSLYSVTETPSGNELATCQRQQLHDFITAHNGTSTTVILQTALQKSGNTAPFLSALHAACKSTSNITLVTTDVPHVLTKFTDTNTPNNATVEYVLALFSLYKGLCEPDSEKDAFFNTVSAALLKKHPDTSLYTLYGNLTPHDAAVRSCLAWQFEPISKLWRLSSELMTQRIMQEVATSTSARVCVFTRSIPPLNLKQQFEARGWQTKKTLATHNPWRVHGVVAQKGVATVALPHTSVRNSLVCATVGKTLKKALHFIR